jgi:hypothetical protein
MQAQPSVYELKSLLSVSFLIKNLIGVKQYMGRLKSCYMDANLQHDLLTQRAVTGILHLLNQAPGDWYSKLQATVETATFGSEFTAARIAVDQILALQMPLRYLGVPVIQKSYMFGNSQAVVTNITIPHSSLNNRHNDLSYHMLREMIAAKILGYYWIDGRQDPADVVI